MAAGRLRWIALAVIAIGGIAASCKKPQNVAPTAASAASSQAPPPPSRRPAELLPFADAPVGMRVTLDRESLTAPKVLLRGASQRVCAIEIRDKTLRCASGTDAGSADPRVARLPSGPLYRWSELSDGSALALVGKPEKGLEPQPGARFFALSANGPVAEIPAPELDRSDERAMTLAGDWLLWSERAKTDAKVQGRRWDAALGRLGAPVAITAAPSSMSFLDACVRRSGRAVLLAAPGIRRYQAQDPFVVLFQNGDSWQAASGEKAHLYPDPDPAFPRAKLDCDDGGIWLTWTGRVPGLNFARCTPAGCRYGSFALRGAAANSRALELGGRVFLIMTTGQPPTWGIAFRAETFGRVGKAPETPVVGGAYLEDVLALGESAVLLARSENPPRAAAFLLGSSGRVESIRPVD